MKGDIHLKRPSNNSNSKNSQKTQNQESNTNNEKAIISNSQRKKNSISIENKGLDNNADENKNKIIDPNALVYNSIYLPKSKINDYNGLCEELKTLEIQLYIKNRIKNSNSLSISDELESEIIMMKKKSELSDFGYDFYNIEEIFKIIEIVKKPPELRTMDDLLKIVKYLTITKLGKYFKEEFEQKDIFEKLITFCGVEMKYKLFKKGETVFKIGELPDYFYMVLYGKMDILKPFPKNMSLTGYQYFCYLMDLKRNKEDYLFYLCIQENISNFYIKKEEARDLDYIYLLNIVDKISRHKIVDFAKALKVTGMTCEDFDLDPNEIGSNKYLLENIKKIKRKLPDISGAITQKYLFLDENTVAKDIIIYDYFKFLTAEAKSHFGDSAMDSNTTRNATVLANEDTHVAIISNSLYYKNVVVEKAAVVDRKIQFLNTNFIFWRISAKKFEKKYFGWFICNNYKKGDIIFNEGDAPYYVYFIEQGDVELYTSKNIFEFQKTIDYLEKDRNNFLKIKLMEKSDEQNYKYMYDKINFDCSELKEQIYKKDKKRIFLLKNNEDMGMLSFYYGYPYLVSSVVSSTKAKIYKIDNKYLSEMIIKEKQIYFDLVKRIENKISLFYQRFFNINNMKLSLADHKKMIDNLGANKNREKYINNHSYNNNEINGVTIIRNIINDNNKQPPSKNEFNKNNNIQVNYHKIKEIFNKTSFNQSLDNNNANGSNNTINNIRMNLPIIKSQKRNKSDYGNFNDSIYIINNSEMTRNKSKEKKSNSQKNILSDKKGFKRILKKRSIELIKNKSKNNLLASHMSSFNNKSCIFLNQTNYCIDPILKKNCSYYEKLQNNSFIKNKNQSMEELEIKTQAFFHHHNLFNKFVDKNYLNKLKSFYKASNNDNNSISINNRSMKKNIDNYSKDEDNYNSTSCMRKKNGVNIVNIDDIYENKKNIEKDKEINIHNHPYYAPLVVTKKEKYKIFTDDYFNKRLKYEKKIKKEINKKNGLNEFGFPLNSIKKLNKNRSYRNDYLKIKIKGIKYYQELVEKKTNK